MSCDSYDEYGHPHNDGDPGCLCTDCAHDTLQRARFLEAENSRLTQQLIRANDDANKYCREANRFFDEVLALTQERDEAYLRSVRIAAERAFIEQGRESRYWRGAYQIARDIAALNGIDFDSLDFNGSEQKKIRELYWPDQQEAAELTRAHTEPQEEREKAKPIDLLASLQDAIDAARTQKQSEEKP